MAAFKTGDRLRKRGNELEMGLSGRDKQAQRLDDMCEFSPDNIAGQIDKRPMGFWKQKNPRREAGASGEL